MTAAAAPVVHEKPKFFALRLNVIDRNEKYYTFNLSNRRSIVKVDGCTCDLPLVVGEGWQYVAVPLAELTRRCFGADYYACVQVRVHASCVLLRARRRMQESAQADVRRRSNTLQAASARVLSVTSGLPCDSLSDTPSAPLRCSPHTQW